MAVARRIKLEQSPLEWAHTQARGANLNVLTWRGVRSVRLLIDPHAAERCLWELPPAVNLERLWS
jgi:hypothetical protein